MRHFRRWFLFILPLTLAACFHFDWSGGGPIENAEIFGYVDCPDSTPLHFYIFGKDHNNPIPGGHDVVIGPGRKEFDFPVFPGEFTVTETTSSSDSPTVNSPDAHIVAKVAVGSGHRLIYVGTIHFQNSNNNLTPSVVDDYDTAIKARASASPGILQTYSPEKQILPQ